MATEEKPQRLFEDTMCLQVKFAQGQPLHDLEMVRELGVKWVREEIAWPSIEPRRGVYQPLPETLKTRLNFYKANDIGVIFIMAYENPVAYPNTPQAPHDFVNPLAFGRYTAYMARQLKGSGVKFVVELWNEPHNSAFARKEHLGGNWQGAPPSPWVDHYVKMVDEAVKRIKAVDPTIPVITNDDMWIVHYHFLEKGLPKTLDGFAVHPYVQGPPEITAVAHDTDWTRPYQVVDQDRSFESAVRRLKEQGLKKMGKIPNIWITEWGWPVGGNSPTGPLSESKVAVYLPRAFILAANAGVQNTCWFSSMDGPDGPMGLKTNDGRKRPAYAAFLNMSQTLAKTKFECELKQNEPNSTKRTFAFKRSESDDWIIASWDTKGKSFYDEAVEYTQKSSAEFAPVCKPKPNLN